LTKGWAQAVSICRRSRQRWVRVQGDREAVLVVDHRAEGVSAEGVRFSGAVAEGEVQAAEGVAAVGFTDKM
jgi:hypothetical protein